MDPSTLVKSLTFDVYERLRTAVETGRWPDGQALTQEQRENSMQLVMLYQSQVLNSDEHMTVNGDGEIVHKSKSALRQEMREENQIARFKQDDL